MRSKLAVKILISILICLGVGLIASVATQSSVNTWFSTLEKPFFNPPPWLFAPVWIVLYIVMGVSVALIWHKGLYHLWVKTAIYHFGFQLLLNALWSIAFFGLMSPLFGLVVILSLIVLLLLTYKWFKVVYKPAAYLLIPYMIWIFFAAALNFEIWRLNSL